MLKTKYSWFQRKKTTCTVPTNQHGMKHSVISTTFTFEPWKMDYMYFFSKLAAKNDSMTLKTINLSDMYYFSSPKTCPQALILFLYYYVYWHSRPIWIVKTLFKTSWGEVETRSMMRCLPRCDAVWVSWLKKLLKVTGTIDIMLSKYIINNGTWFCTTYGLKINVCNGFRNQVDVKDT